MFSRRKIKGLSLPMPVLWQNGPEFNLDCYCEPYGDEG